LGSCFCLASLSGLRRILRVASLIACLGVAVLAPEINAQSAAVRPEVPGSAVQTIDIASLISVLDLDGPWRFHAGDDPHFADPALDDSAWPSVRPNQPFKAVGIPPLPAGYLWTRIHLHVPTTAGPLALAVYPSSGQQYEIFVNGSSIASTPGMATRTLRVVPSFPVALPPSGDIVLAIRFYCGVYPTQSLPFTRISIGSFGAIRIATEFDHLRSFNNGPLAIYACICVTLLMAITSMILYNLQRDHDEYLWLGILALDFAVYAFFDIARLSGWLPIRLPVILVHMYTGLLCMAMEIEFVARFTRIRRRWPVRIVQSLILIIPALDFSPSTWHYGLALVIAWAAMIAVMTACFVSAYRRGLADSGLFFLFLVVWVANDVLNLACDVAIVFPGSVPWAPDFHFGPVGISGTYLANLVCSLGIAAIVLYRLMRVARDEAHAAAELEAARAIQRVLIPAQPASAPGISIDAAFSPAREVGGDFYRCRVLPDGSQWILIGDVSGKGTAAGITGAMLLGAAGGHESDPPAKQLSRLNQELCNSGIGGFVTCLVLHISPDAVVTAANAGHLAPYRNGEEVELDSGFPLGITSEAAYSETRFELDDGDRLTLLSDGVVEARNQSGELFGFSRTRDISGLSAEEIASAAQGFGQNDDITVLTLSYVRLTAASLREGHRLAKIL
jgi:phosphoserine phosphatase RsbU/P